MLSKPSRHAIERNYLVDFKAGPNNSPFCVFDKHFRG